MANEKVYTGKIGAQELYKRLKGLIPAVDDELNIESLNPISNHAVTEALRNFGGFKKVNGTGEDNHPDVDDPSPKIIYLVEVPGTPEPDHSKEWIWDVSGGTGVWSCIGTTSLVIDTELDPESGNPVANSVISGEIERIDDKIDTAVERLDDKIDTLDAKVDTEVTRLDQAIADEHDYAEGEVSRLDGRIDTLDTKVDTEVTRLDGRIDTLDTKVDTEVARLEQAIIDEHAYTVEQVERLDIRIDDLSLIITDVEGVISGTTMTVEVKNSTYTRFSVPPTIETIIVTIDDPATSGNVSKAMFEFTLPEVTALNDVRVLDGDENDRRVTSPMRWPGTVTYQGTITNGIATILGYSPTKFNGEWLSTDNGKLLTTSTGKHIKYVLQ